MPGRACILAIQGTLSRLPTRSWPIGIGRFAGSTTSSCAAVNMVDLPLRSSPANGSLTNRSMAYGPATISASSRFCSSPLSLAPAHQKTDPVPPPPPPITHKYKRNNPCTPFPLSLTRGRPPEPRLYQVSTISQPRVPCAAYCYLAYLKRLL